MRSWLTVLALALAEGASPSKDQHRLINVDHGFQELASGQEPASGQEWSSTPPKENPFFVPGAMSISQEQVVDFAKTTIAELLNATCDGTYSPEMLVLDAPFIEAFQTLLGPHFQGYRVVVSLAAKPGVQGATAGDHDVEVAVPTKFGLASNMKMHVISVNPCTALPPCVQEMIQQAIQKIHDSTEPGTLEEVAIVQKENDEGNLTTHRNLTTDTQDVDDAAKGEAMASHGPDPSPMPSPMPQTSSPTSLLTHLPSRAAGKFASLHHTQGHHEKDAMMVDPRLARHGASLWSPRVTSLAYGSVGDIPSAYDPFKGTDCVSKFPARNQGACGSCVLFAVTTVVSLNYCKAGGWTGPSTPVFSPQGMMSCGTKIVMEKYGLTQKYSKGCSGGFEDSTFAYAMDYGMAFTACNPVVSNNGKSEEHFDAAGNPHAYPACRSTCIDGTPIRKFKIPGFESSFDPPAPANIVPPPIGKSAVYAVGERDMANLIQQYGAVEAAFIVYGDFQSFNFGTASNPNVYTEPPKSTPSIGAHAVSCYGWGTTSDGTKYWKCINSWGANWGAEGRSEFYYRRGVANSIFEQWGFWAHNKLDKATVFEGKEGEKKKDEKDGGLAAQLSCFAKGQTKACRIADVGRTEGYLVAYETCYKGGTAAGIELVDMSDIRAGDHVLTADQSGALSVTRVLVNQHSGAYANASSRILTLALDNGASISLTADHALYANGVLVAASSAVVGSTLVMAHGQTVKVTHVKDVALAQVVNPITVAGTVLASDDGEPILAASHPMWIAPYLLHPASPMALVLSKSISYLAPKTTQAYYDRCLEPILSASGVQSSLVLLRNASPDILTVAGLLLVDILVCAGLALFLAISTLGACTKVMVTVAVLGGCRSTLMRRALKRARASCM